MKFTCLKRMLLPAAVAGLVLTCVTGGLGASYKATVLQDQPVGYWRLEELPGSGMAEDSGPYGLSGTFTFDATATYPVLGAPGIETNSVQLHTYKDANDVQQNTFITVPYSAELNPMDANKNQLPFSVEVWARPMSGDPVNYRSPVGNFGGWGDSSGWFFYQSPETAGVSSWIWVQKGGGIWMGGGNIQKGRWDHLCATFNGTTLTFYVNGAQMSQQAVSGTLANSSLPFCIGARDTGYGYFDGFVDEVAIYTNALTAAQVQLHYSVGITNFRIGAMPPVILTDPKAITNYAGKVTKFTVTADGTAPLAYQWYKGTTAINGATTDTLNYTPVAGDNGALIKVVVTNQYGSATSASAQLTVLTDLFLLAQPETINRYEGSWAAFRVSADGASPISYQWYQGATPIAGGTNATLWLKNIAQSDNGNSYYARVTNPYTSTNSDPAILNVNPRPVVVPKTGYAKLVMADEPVAYWRLDEAAGSGVVVDAAGSFDGSYNDNSGAGVFEYAQPGGVPYDTNTGLGVTNGARVQIDYALELNPYGPFTFEGWFKPSSRSADDGDYRSVFASMGNGVGGPIGWNLYQTPGHQFAWFLWGDNWINSGVWGAAGSIQANQWHHVVLNYDGTTFRLYLNGALQGSSTWAGFIPNRNGRTVLGWRTDLDWKPFRGTIDDVAFYNKALDPRQIETHFTGSARVSAVKVGDKVVISWPLGTLEEASTVNGNYSTVVGAVSPLTNTPSAAPKYYRLKIQ